MCDPLSNRLYTLLQIFRFYILIIRKTRQAYALVQYEAIQHHKLVAYTIKGRLHHQSLILLVINRTRSTQSTAAAI